MRPLLLRKQNLLSAIIPCYHCWGSCFIVGSISANLSWSIEVQSKSLPSNKTSLRGGYLPWLSRWFEGLLLITCLGAVAVMALERVPADIRKNGGVARMSDPTIIAEIKNAVTIPVMAKARIGHFVEAQILEALGIDYIDESEVRMLLVDILHDWTQWTQRLWDEWPFFKCVISTKNEGTF